MATLTVIDPRVEDGWQEFVRDHAEATVFHTADWADVLCESYGYTPRYFVLRRASGEIVAGAPTMLVSSILTGKRLVGLPFSDYCAPLADQTEQTEELLAAIKREVDEKHLRYVELRGPCGTASYYQASSGFVVHLIDLSVGADKLLARLDSSARRGMKKAAREGVEVRLARSVEEMRQFYRLHTATRRRHGLVPQPWRFFERIHAHLIHQGIAFLLIAVHRGRVIAGDLVLRHKQRLTYKFNASDYRFLAMRPNNALIWQAMLLGAELGCSILDLGRCESSDEGLRRFKAIWGSYETALPYYYYPAIEGITAESNNPGFKFRLLNAILRLTPSPLLPPIGAMVYRHLG